MDEDKEIKSDLSRRQWLGGWALIIALCVLFWLIVYGLGNTFTKDHKIVTKPFFSS